MSHPYNGVLFNNTSEQLIHTLTWVNLKGIMSCEISQSQNNACFHLNYVLDNTKL